MYNFVLHKGHSTPFRISWTWLQECDTVSNSNTFCISDKFSASNSNSESITDSILYAYGCADCEPASNNEPHINANS